MSWSWRIGRIAGIDVFVHFTFLLLLGWVAMIHLLGDGQLGAAIRGLLFICCLFGIVVLHELGHALAARRYGIKTRDITLLPIGGVARLERMPDDPRQELVVALAGPAVNVVMAAAIFTGLLFSHGFLPIENVVRVGGGLLDQLLWVNVVLAVFNMIPAFPMDGGRVLRAVLAMRLDYVRATQIAASIGQAIALLFGFIGLFINPFLIFIALFVWLGAAQEASMVQMRSALDGIPVMRAMVTDFRTLRPSDPLSLAVDYILASSQQDFPVVEEDRLVGMLTRSELGESLGKLGPEGRVEEAMHRDTVTADPFEMLQTALARLGDRRSHTVPVVQNGRVVGLMTTDNLAEVLMIQTALGEVRSRVARNGTPDTAGPLLHDLHPVGTPSRSDA